MNVLKTTFLLTALTLLLVLLGDHFGGQRGLVLGFVLAAGMNFVSYFYSDKIALAMYRAQPVNSGALPRVERALAALSGRANVPMPKLYVLPTQAPNAFATGRNPAHASVAVTEGILQLLNDEELEGVLAHEMSHVRNRDILISSIAATLAGAITIIARMGWWASLFGGFGGRDRDREGGFTALLMLILAPIAAMLIQFAVSRSREYAADASGAKLTGNPYALASALEKLEGWNRRIPTVGATPSTAHLFIVSPLFSGASLAGLFSTHPPTAKRIERLTGRPPMRQVS